MQQQRAFWLRSRIFPVLRNHSGVTMTAKNMSSPSHSLKYLRISIGRHTILFEGIQWILKARRQNRLTHTDHTSNKAKIETVLSLIALPYVAKVLLCCSNMKSLIWAGSAYPESIFLGAAICCVLKGFSGPNCNVTRKKIIIIRKRQKFWVYGS